MWKEMLRPMLTELHRLDLGTFQTLEGKQLIRKQHGFVFWKFNLRCFFVVFCLFGSFCQWGNPLVAVAIEKPQALGAASDCGWHVAAAAASIGTGNETDAGHPRGFQVEMLAVLFEAPDTLKLQDERWKRSVNLETRDFAACYSGSLYEYIDIDHAAD